MKRNAHIFTVITLLFALLPFGSSLSAQAPLNDDCTGATVIADPTNYCSGVSVENNFFATPSNVLLPTCANQMGNDVWYTFTAVNPQIEILVLGTILSNLNNPAIVLYSGNCATNMTEIGCATGSPLPHYQVLNMTNLVAGQSYYIRIGSSFEGDFQLCLRSGLLEDEVSGDCATATVICDKDPIFVPFVAGPGEDFDEWEGAPCLIGFPGESDVSWFVFTAATNGTLEFTLTPENPNDDLDFMVHHLPNGPDDCAAKILERCMVAGEVFPSLGCFGPTGLNTIATDISQPPGCLPGDDNFLMFMDLVAGESYTLSVNNFTTSGTGFTIEWGGTAEFEGPKVGFISDDADNIICLGEQIVFTDTSSYDNGTIEDWQWTFGISASPYSDTTIGPHTVQYLNKGLKTVELIIRADLGCLVRKYLEIQVDSCCSIMASVELEADCLPDSTCQKALAIVADAVAPFQYTWSSGQTDSVATALYAGTYTLTVQDAFGCADTVEFTVDLKEVFEIPNAFTPNGDQANDIFQPVIIKSGVQVLQIQVWNRWGELVHDGTDNGWDGNVDGLPAPSDVYLYRIKYRRPGGEEVVESKDLTLLR